MPLISQLVYLRYYDDILNIYNQTKIETFSKHYFEIERGQKVTKKPNFFFEAKQEKKKPKSSYLASNRPNYQPWLLGNVINIMTFLF